MKLVQNFWRPRRLILVSSILAVGTLAPACAQEEDLVEYPYLFLSVSSDPPPDGGARIDALRVSIRGIGADGRPAGPNVTLEIGDGRCDAALGRCTLDLPPSVRLHEAAYTLGLQPGKDLQKTWVLLEGQRSGTTVASWAGRVDAGLKGVQAAHLVWFGADCDADGDGVKKCAPGCPCTEDEKILADCDDSPATGASISPLGKPPECIPCGDPVDYDCDGTPDACVDGDQDGVADCQDCAPGDGAVYPGAAEACDGVDNDCDGKTDEGIAPKPCGEGRLGVCATAEETCVDGKPVCSFGPSYEAEETTCDGLDNDCDGKTDAEDGLQCGGEVADDWDGDGYTEAQGDCNPYDARIRPGQTKRLPDGRPLCCLAAWKTVLSAALTARFCDFDCDGEADWCAADDADGDGFSTVTGDCDDADPTTYPGAPERCGENQNCVQGPLDCSNLDDVDGDGWPAKVGGTVVDCDDTKANVHPNAPELCDGIDNDCNGIVDDRNPETPTYGAFDAAPMIPVCAEYPNPARRFGLCTEGKNPGFQVCAHGLVAYSGTSYRDQTIALQAGGANIKVVCVGFHLPVDTEAACDGVDESCDGEVDEDFDMIGLDGVQVVAAGSPCGVGVCAGQADSFTVCNAAGTGLTCPAEDLATDEICDGADNDCDGKTDADDPIDLVSADMTACELQDGVCGGASKPATLCVGGTWQPCPGAVYAAHNGAYEADVEASCDGKDHDCNGGTDEDFVLTLKNGLTATGIDDPCGTGACGGGLTQCDAAGTGLVCPTESAASDELCDGKDNDCDGVTDDELSEANRPLCEKQSGVCQGSRKPQVLCDAGIWKPCTNGEYAAHSTDYQPGAETACDTLDNDCDGETDEDFQVTLRDGSTVQGAGKTCGAGECAGGQTECTPDGTAIRCSKEVTAPLVDESCNDKDDDCDGKADALEGFTWKSIPMGNACDGEGICGQGTVECAKDGSGKATCSTNPNGSAPDPATAANDAVCNDKDDDCDGQTDEDATWTPPGGGPLHKAAVCDGIGECGAGTVVCDKLKQSATCSTNPSAPGVQVPPETCDAKDNDCDGQTDQGLGFDQSPCKREGVCTAGVVATCAQTGPGQAEWQCNYAGVTGYEDGTEVSCDGKDNDCDGLVDDADPDVPNLSPDLGLCPQTGVCAGQKAVCQGAQGYLCPFGTIAGYLADEEALENCDNQDNDCDGQTDEHFPTRGTSCTEGLGTCAQTGTWICNPAKNGVVCSVSGKPLGAACDDGNPQTSDDKCTGGAASACVGTPYTCDPQPCHTTVYNGDGTCTHTLDPSWCFINQTCFQQTATNPLNQCQVCDTAQSTAVWSNKPDDVTGCDDGLDCSTNDRCQAGQCKGDGVECSDGLICTVDACAAGGTGACDFSQIVANFCKIETSPGVFECFGHGELNPANDCQACDAAFPEQWSNRSNGATCDDGEWCTAGDTCSSGTCTSGATRPCDDANPCTDDSCQTGLPVGTGCQHANNTAPCATDNLDCTTDVCSGGGCTHPVVGGSCAIEGACYADGAKKTPTGCEQCAAATSQTAWSPLAGGTGCNDGQPCTKDDVCQAPGGQPNGVCAGTPMTSADCTDGKVCTDDECVIGTGCVHTDRVGSCTTDGLFCTDDVCDAGECIHLVVVGCAVPDGLGGTTCVADASPNPGNACQACVPATSKTSYSNVPDQTLCDADGSGCTAGDACVNGACVAGSPVDCAAFSTDCTPAVCVSSGPDAASCEPGTPLGDGTPCTSDGIDCTDDICQSGLCQHPITGCYIGDTCVAEGGQNGDLACHQCIPAKSQSAYSVVDGSCLIESAPGVFECVANATENPGNPCQVCDAAADPNGWSDRNAGADCTDDGLTCTSDICDGAGNCVHPKGDANTCLIGGACYADGADDPANTCNKCFPVLNAFIPKGVNAPCSDGNTCTHTDLCNASAVCAGTAYACDAPGQCQTAAGATCNGDGTCTYAPANEGGGCDDGDPCTSGDSCQSGTCAGTPYTCNSPEVCQTATGATCLGDGTCNYPADGALEGLPCSNGELCTAGETCSAGVCGGGAPKDCTSADDDCNVGVCQPGTGDCVATPANGGAGCEDGLFCTTGETCTDGVCGGGSQRDCSAATDDCNTGVCDEGADACVGSPTNEGGTCNDGQACTLGDVCTAGTCGGLCRSHLRLVVLSADATVGGVVAETRDVLLYDETAQTWAMYFDGSDVGVPAGRQIDALAVDPATGVLLMSFSTDTVIPGFTDPPGGGNTIKPGDVVGFVPITTGTNTTGAWTFLADASDVDDPKTSSLAIAGPDGSFLLTSNPGFDPGSDGISGATTAQDVYVFTPTAVGPTTTGTYAFLLDGSDVGLSGADEAIDAMDRLPDGSFLFSFAGPGPVTAGGVTAGPEDLLRFVPSSTGYQTTAGTWSLLIDGSAIGIPGGVNLVATSSLPVPACAAVCTPP